MAGTVALPDSDGPFAAVLLITGSGQLDRDENCKKLRINAFREIAHNLAARRIASLRYDKRGVGASEGNFWETGFFDNVADAGAALACLKSHPRIRGDAVFLTGHSEGALIATRLGADHTDIAGIILLAGPAQPGEAVLKWQAKRVVRGMRGFNKFLINLLHINVEKAQQKQIDKIKRSSRPWYRVKLIAKVNAKWMREFMAYNPAEDFPKIRVPTLAVTGSKDIQIDPKDLLRMSELMQSEFEYNEVPDISHLLRLEAGEPSIATYKKQVRQPVHPRILHLIAEWLANHIDKL